MARSWLTIFVCALTLTLLAGCSATPPLSAYHRLDLPAHSDAPILTAERHGDLIKELRSGDIILGVKEDPITILVRLTTTQYSYFTHCGVVEVVDDNHGGRSARVWNAIGDFSLLHFSPHVLGHVRGGVRTKSLEDFIRSYDALGIIRLPDAQKNAAMVEVCRSLQKQGVAFDPFIDCRDASALYCTELLARAVRDSGYDFNVQPWPRTHNQRVSALMTGWNITAPAIYKAGQFENLPGAQSIAFISRYGRMETYLAMRDAMRLIQERVNASEAEANDFGGFDNQRLAHFSPRMNLLMRGVINLSRTAPTTDHNEIRRRSEILYRVSFGRQN